MAQEEETDAERTYEELQALRGVVRAVQKAGRRYADALRAAASARAAFAAEIERLAKAHARESLVARHGVYIAKTLGVTATHERALEAGVRRCCDDGLGVFLDFDYQELWDLHRRRLRERDRTSPSATASSPVSASMTSPASASATAAKTATAEAAYAAALDAVATKRSTRVLGALADMADSHGAYYGVAGRLAATLRGKTAELRAQLGAVAARGAARLEHEGVARRRGGERVLLMLRTGVLRVLREGRDFAPDDIETLTCSVRVPGAAAGAAEDWPGHYRLEVHSAHAARPLVVYTDTAHARDAWAAALRESTKQQLILLSFRRSRYFDSATAAAALSATAAEAAAATTPEQDNQKQEQQQQQKEQQQGGSETVASNWGELNVEVLARVRAVDGNGVCAECGAADPEWAAANHGIVLCVDCSGVHRALGTHVSRVRSLTLDRWTPEAVLLLLAVGNAHHNTVYEALLPPSGAPTSSSNNSAQRPTPHSPRAVREEFIRLKYASRAFVADRATTEAEAAALGERLVEAAGAEASAEAGRAVLALLARGAPVGHRAAAQAHATALHAAVRAGNVLAVEALLAHGADAGAGDARGWTPAHYAAFFNRPRCLARLLQCADVLAHTPWALHPADVAAWNAAPEAARLLRGRPDPAVELTLARVAADPDACIRDAFTSPRSTVLPPLAHGAEGASGPGAAGADNSEQEHELLSPLSPDSQQPPSSPVSPPQQKVMTSPKQPPPPAPVSGTTGRRSARKSHGPVPAHAPPPRPVVPSPAVPVRPRPAPVVAAAAATPPVPGTPPTARSEDEVMDELLHPRSRATLQLAEFDSTLASIEAVLDEVHATTKDQ